MAEFVINCHVSFHRGIHSAPSSVTVGFTSISYFITIHPSKHTDLYRLNDYNYTHTHTHAHKPLDKLFLIECFQEIFGTFLKSGTNEVLVNWTIFKHGKYL